MNNAATKYSKERWVQMEDNIIKEEKEEEEEENGEHININVQKIYPWWL